MDIYHLNKLTRMLLLAIFLFSVSTVGAVDDTTYPNSVSVQSNYTLNDTLMTVDDTLIITRTFINNEATALTCFYFCDNLPDAFSIVSYTITVNNIPITHDYPTPIASSAYSNHTEYYWVLDYPGTHGTYDLLVQPTETVVVQYKITCSAIGTYPLPMHTFIGHNGTTGIFGYSDSLEVRFDVSLDIDDKVNLPNSFSLRQNYPNPFNPTTTIEFSLPVNSFTTIEIYNLLGQSVATLVKQNLPAGNHIVTWNGLNDNGKTATSGVYLYKLLTKNQKISKKMLMLK